MEKQEVIALVESQVREQVSELRKGEYVDCYELEIKRKFKSKRRGSGVKHVIGFMTPKELKADTPKAGFSNGHLTLRPTLPILDHSNCRLRRHLIPVKHILGVRVKVITV